MTPLDRAVAAAKLYLMTGMDDDLVDAHVDADWPNEPDKVLVDGSFNLRKLIEAVVTAMEKDT